MGLFKKIDKTQPNWREERSGIFNALCRAGAALGAIGKKIGPEIVDIGWDVLGRLVDTLVPQAVESVLNMIAKLTPKGVALIQGLIKDVDDLDLPGEEKFLQVLEGASDWLESSDKNIDKFELQTYIQNLFYQMRKNGDI